MESGIKACNLRYSGKGKTKRTDPINIVGLMQRCQRAQLAQSGQNVLVNCHSIAISLPAVHHPVCHRLQAQPLQGLFKQALQGLQRTLKRVICADVDALLMVSVIPGAPG